MGLITLSDPDFMKFVPSMPVDNEYKVHVIHP